MPSKWWVPLGQRSGPNRPSSPAPSYWFDQKTSRPRFGAEPSSPQSNQYAPRGFPESIAVDDYIPEAATGEVGGVAGAIDTGFRFPAHIVESPFAFLDTALPGTIDSAVEAVRSIPIAGQHISNAGALAENAFDFTYGPANLLAAPVNATLARLWDSTKDNEEGDSIGLFDEIMAVVQGKASFTDLLSPGAITKADLREAFHADGWDDKDLSDLEDGTRGWLDFSDKQISLADMGLIGAVGLPFAVAKNAGLYPNSGDFAGVEDLALRMLGDPLNLVFGAGAISKLGHVFRLGKVATKLGKPIAPLSEAMQVTAIKTIARRRVPWMIGYKAAPIDVGVQQLGKGSIRGVSKAAAAKFVMKKLTYSDNPVKAYRNLAYGSTTAQVGINTVDLTLNGDNEPADGFMGEVFDFARRWGENKPLSKNDLFSLYMIMKVPGRTIAGAAVKPISNKLNARRKFQIQNQISEKMYPELNGFTKGKARDYAPGWARVVEELGGQLQADGFLGYITQQTVHLKDFLEGVPSLPNILHAGSMAESGAVLKQYTTIMNKLVKDALESGGLKARDVNATIENFAQRGGLIDKASKGVRADFRTEDVVRSWKAWSIAQEALSKAFKDGTPMGVGITGDLVTTDDIYWALAHLDVLKSTEISGAELFNILNTVPAVFNFPGGDKLARAMTRDGLKGTYAVKDIKASLNSIVDDGYAISRAKYVAAFEEWEGLSMGTQDLLANVSRRLNEGGLLDNSISPDINNAATATFDLASAEGIRGMERELGGAGMGVIRRMRASVSGLRQRYDVPAGLKLGGYDVISATDSIAIIGVRGGRHGSAVPTLQVRINPDRPFMDGIDVVTIGLENSAGNKGRVFLRGKDKIAKAGVETNAEELTYNIGRKTEDEWNQLINAINDEFGDFVLMNDTSGNVRVLLADYARGRGEKRLKKIDQLLGGKPTTERIVFRDVVKGKQYAETGAVQGRDYVLFKDQLKTTKLSRNYAAAREYIDLGVGGHAGAGARHLGPSTDAQARALARGQYPDGANGKATHATPTDYEFHHGGVVRVSSNEYRVDVKPSGTKRLWEERIQEAGNPDAPYGDAFSFGPGDRLYRSKSATAHVNDAGVVVRGNGEIIPWYLDPDNLPDDWGELLAESSREGTWSRFIDIDGPTGIGPVDLLGKHGYVPVLRGKIPTGEPGQLADIVYLAFDPDDFHGMALNNRRWAEAKVEGHKAVVGLDGKAVNDPQTAYYHAMSYVDALHPQRTERLLLVAEREKIAYLNEQAALKDAEIAAKQNELGGGANFNLDEDYRRLVRERDAILAEHSGLAGQSRHDQILTETINPGNVTFIAGAEKDITKFKPRLDESIGAHLDSLPAGEIEKVYALERELRLSGSYVDRTGKLVDSTNYRLKRLPKQATPYTHETGEAYRAMMQGRMAAEDGWRTFTTSKFAQGQQLLFGRVYAIEMQTQMRQEMYNDLLNRGGATVSEVNSFIKTLQGFWEVSPSILGAKVFRSADMLTPGLINKIARGEVKMIKGTFDGFSPEVVARVGDFADVVQRSSSRTFRNLAKKYPAQDGRGNLGKLIEVHYGKQPGRGAGASKVVRNVTYKGSVVYNVLRFILDPRWYAMNAFESDILGMARWGAKVRGIAGGKARGTGIRGHMTGVDPSVPRDKFVERFSPRRKDSELLSIDEILHANTGASGWQDPRNLYGYVAEASKVGRRQIADKMFKQMIDDGSPVIDDLRAKFGDNQQAWFDEIDDALYSIDTIGAKRTILDNELAKTMMNDPVMGPVYTEFLTNLWKQHRQMFKDVTHTFHGNVNRSNMERLLNSPILFWPISYQLKTGKWLIDVMTKSFLGGGSELAGTGMIAKLLANHQNAMETNDEYRNLIDGHPALFRALSMMLPITPFDMGVFMARWTRYAGSWTGAQLSGLTDGRIGWDQDESYPQDPINFMARSLSLGPIYSWDIIGDIGREFNRSESKKFRDDSPKWK